MEEKAEAIRAMFSKVDEIIQNSPLKDMNFGLFYQDGRLSLMDLDAFAESTKVRLEKDGEEKSLTELTKDIDKSKE